MECREALLLLWEYLDQELGPKESRAVATHLRRCRECYPAYCCDRALLDLLARQRRSSAPSALVRSIQVLLGAHHL